MNKVTIKTGFQFFSNVRVLATACMTEVDTTGTSSPQRTVHDHMPPHHPSHLPPQRSRLKVTLPGRTDGNSLVSWDELSILEKQYGASIVGEWLKGGSLVFPREEEPPKTQEFVDHMTSLKRRQEQREYATMMEGAIPKGTYLSTSMTSYSPEHTGVGASGFQLAVVGLNMVIGIGCAYVGADYLGKQYGFSPIQRVAMALTAMILVMFLEMVLFIIRAGKFDELDKNRRLRTENNFGPVPSGRRIVAHPPPMLVEEFVDPINKKTN